MVELQAVHQGSRYLSHAEKGHFWDVSVAVRHPDDQRIQEYLIPFARS